MKTYYKEDGPFVVGVRMKEKNQLSLDGINTSFEYYDTGGSWPTRSSTIDPPPVRVYTCLWCGWSIEEPLAGVFQIGELERIQAGIKDSLRFHHSNCGEGGEEGKGESK